MKQWTEEDLILFYYQELDEDQLQKIKLALSDSSDLQDQYNILCKLLDKGLNINVPKPSDDLNQQIMAGVYQAEFQIAQKSKTIGQIDSHNGIVQKLSGWIFTKPVNNYVAVSVALIFTVIAIFFLGRWTAEPIQQVVVYPENPKAASNAYRFDKQVSRRILLANLS
jgi:hypothetical protein